MMWETYFSEIMNTTMAKTLSLTKVSTTEVEITIYRNISEQVDSRSQSLLKSKSDFHVSNVQILFSESKIKL